MNFRSLNLIQASSLDSHAESPIVGIDLGTTNSLVAAVRDGAPTVIQSRDGRSLLPSVVHFEDEKRTIQIGYGAKAKKVLDAKNTIFSVKRLLGRSYEDLKEASSQLPYRILPGEGVVRIEVGSKTFTVIEISALILRELKAQAEASLGKEVRRAVITVPAYFNDSQRQATRLAGRLAGLDVLRIVNEPTAAALAYGLHHKKNGLIAVYDFGGGTFDISILKLHNGIFEVLATHGDTVLGGDDLDQAIVQRLSTEMEERFQFNCKGDIKTKAKLLEVAESVKIAFSEKEETTVEIPPYKRVITRSEFETWVTPVLERTRVPCLQALKDAGVELSDLTDVVLVGGPTRLKIVQKMAHEIFKREPNTSVHPDEVVALGAAIQADILAGNNKEFLLLDVVPLSLGIETYGGLMSTLVPRNTRIPAVAREFFTNFATDQTSVDIHVFQGEREQVKDNRSLAHFKLKGIQPMPAGMARIEVTFLIDADGVLQVSAKDLHTGLEQVVEVKPSYGLMEQEIEKMLRESSEHAVEDKAFRQFTEARQEAEQVIASTEKNRAIAKKQLSVQEQNEIETALESAKKSLETGHAAEVRSSLDRLNRATIRLAELVIKEAVSKVGTAKMAQRQGAIKGGD